MAGKIALGVLVAVMIGLTCFAAGWYRREERMVEYTVIRVVTEDDGQSKNARGVPVPYTVVGYQPRHTAIVLPGILGQPGSVVKIPADD